MPGDAKVGVKPVPSAKLPSVNVAREAQAAVKALVPALARLRKAAAVDLGKAPPGALADWLYDLRQAKATLSTVTAAFDDVLPPVIKSVDDHFIETLKVGEASGVQGMRSRVQVTDTPIPQVRAEDWLKFFAYVAKTRQWELLTHAVSREAVKERWDQKKRVKFVTAFYAKRVSCTKLNGKKGGK
jgi:hypothetical protein